MTLAGKTKSYGETGSPFFLCLLIAYGVNVTRDIPHRQQLFSKEATYGLETMLDVVSNGVLRRTRILRRLVSLEPDHNEKIKKFLTRIFGIRKIPLMREKFSYHRFAACGGNFSRREALFTAQARIFNKNPCLVHSARWGFFISPS